MKLVRARRPRPRPQKKREQNLKKSVFPKVYLKRLTQREIAKHTKRHVTLSSLPANSNPKGNDAHVGGALNKKPVKVRVEYFSETSSSEDEETSSSDSSSRDSSISFIYKQKTQSAWKRKMITVLKGKMNYEIKIMKKPGTPIYHNFKYNRRNHSFSLGRIEITFNENEKTLGCAKCKESWRTSYNESSFYQEITDHILKQHLGKEDDSTVTGNVGGESGENKDNGNGDWERDPDWEDD